ncbi:hypothetical protein [Rheinheimera maricola]|uniref:Uncharacterized protein n=1 Tax=Rheinheimera maricola TaxID=2793282 RepID=A0ABS7XGX1_9GAMM|nr:hypothetical protein [Rheinheimera maricola]MBZ9613787.1 hypothetical protein [Rheinheimera maricola]
MPDISTITTSPITTIAAALIQNALGKDDVTDRSQGSGTSEEVQDFKDDLNTISKPQSDKSKIRVLKPGVTVAELLDKAPGVLGDNGRKQTENGDIGTHGSYSTPNENGQNVETLTVRERKNVWKYRESN